MKTKGFTCGYSGPVTLDIDLPYPSTYITVSDSGGPIVFLNTNQMVEYWPYAFVGYNPIAATRILSSATINGVLRTTTAFNLGYAASSAP